jgi:UDP-MurNAc hydroxylase
MKIRYIYSACVVIETSDLKICCDPWFTQGAYDGSWYQYPPLQGDPIDIIGKVDRMYVSHIHPDHYDPQFLKSYLNRYPETEIIIGETSPPYLERKMSIDGFTPIVITSDKVGNSQIHIFPNHAYENDNIDTALVVIKNELSVVNLNDNPIDYSQLEKIVAVCPNSKPTFALLPYSGAGPYPQTYDFDTIEELEIAANRKQEQFLMIYSQYIEKLQPVRAMPFAGKYFLGGSLSTLNSFRGVPDATIVLDRNSDVSIVLADGGSATFDLNSLTATALRTNAYENEQVKDYLDSIPFSGYTYEKEIQPLANRSLPLILLIQSAYKKNISLSRVDRQFWLCFKPNNIEQYIVLDIHHDSDSGVKVLNDVSSLNPRCEIVIDERYLFGLLSRLYHWNNAEVGSQYRVKRVPDIYDREVYNFLNKFHV